MLSLRPSRPRAAAPPAELYIALCKFPVVSSNPYCGSPSPPSDAVLCVLLVPAAP